VFVGHLLLHLVLEQSVQKVSNQGDQHADKMTAMYKPPLAAMMYRNRGKSSICVDFPQFEHFRSTTAGAAFPDLVSSLNKAATPTTNKTSIPAGTYHISAIPMKPEGFR
jgi:hypothetical protein